MTLWGHCTPALGDPAGAFLVAHGQAPTQGQPVFKIVGDVDQAALAGFAGPAGDFDVLGFDVVFLQAQGFGGTQSGKVPNGEVPHHTEVMGLGGAEDGADLGWGVDVDGLGG